MQINSLNFTGLKIIDKDAKKVIARLCDGKKEKTALGSITKVIDSHIGDKDIFLMCDNSSKTEPTLYFSDTFNRSAGTTLQADLNESPNIIDNPLYRESSICSMLGDFYKASNEFDW